MKHMECLFGGNYQWPTKCGPCKECPVHPVHDLIWVKEMEERGELLRQLVALKIQTSGRAIRGNKRIL